MLCSISITLKSISQKARYYFSTYKRVFLCLHKSRFSHSGTDIVRWVLYSISIIQKSYSQNTREDVSISEKTHEYFTKYTRVFHKIHTSISLNTHKYFSKYIRADSRIPRQILYDGYCIQSS